MAGEPLIDQTYAALLEAFAAPIATPGGISAAALAAAMAAALVERCAATEPTVRSRAVLLRARLVAVADDDIPVLQALAKAAPADRSSAATAASGPAAALRDAAAEVAGLARTMERDGPRRLRGEALCAALLADAAAATAVAVIAANEAHGRPA
jgi:formiminotetrahydrofolate cyclodeaminase